ncbi:MAG: glycosyltransferase family 4 protein [Candidatus Andersenbacteria bacterium]|nr:glycosyltransferase family 4 protein [Candidatus Andersenbacteria bacterium]
MPIPPTSLKACFINLRAYHIFEESSQIATGGAEIALHELAPLLGKHVNTTIITGDFGQGHQIKTQHITLLSSLKLRRQNPFTQLWKFWNALKEARSDVYIESVFGKTVFFTWLFCRLYRKKFIYITASDSECDGSAIKRYPITGNLFKIALEHADVIDVSVAHHEDQLRTHHPNITCPIAYIPLGMHAYTPSATAKRTTILWVARCEPWKNPFLFLELAKRFPKEQFIMIAAPLENQLRLFKEVKQQAKHIKNMRFIEGLPHRKLDEYFLHAKITVNTSDFEGYSMAFMQSGLAGTPIATLNLNPDSVITTHDLGTCAHGDFELLVQQVRTLLEHPEELRKKSNNIASYMRAHYDVERVAEQWLRLFAEMFAS